MKKLAIISAIALLGSGAAFAQEATPQPQDAGVFSTTTALVESSLADLLTKFTAFTDPDAPETSVNIGVLSGAVNLSSINGAIDISGVNVSVGALANNVSATATATAENSNATAYAIAGAKLGTTVIGAMNSATVDVMAKVTEQTEATTSALGIGSLATQNGGPTITTQSFTDGVLGLVTDGSDILAISGEGQSSLTDLTSATSTDAMQKIHELQNMSVFNTALNLASLDAGIKVVASVDPNAWFLNPQSGIVNLSNIEMTTTAIGAMNSSITRLGTNLAK